MSFTDADLQRMDAIQEEVKGERIRQDGLGYTPQHDDQHTPGDFVTLIQQRLSGDEVPASAGEAMLEVAALATACLEMLDRKATA